MAAKNPAAPPPTITTRRLSVMQRTLRAGSAKAKRKSAVPHAADTKMAVAGCNPRRP
jgi:hypothetical protein